ncbi:hypothetical protein FA13DRAFT_715126 [Coprinellus micaceus]|uniref:Uncharacterized protein n=1 Tax=Coprinellus micaceus TaxID=71717 RepID=A0A4Y7TUX1_COPMI|nr:hypothetical protein FA13DRAFT_715126 [Coprinellus micaceus]
MKHSNDWYSHPTRAFHLSLLLDAFKRCYNSQIPETDRSDPRAFNDFRAPPSIESIGVRCFDLTSKECIFRPFAIWAVVHGGSNMPRWKRKRFGDMTNLLKASHLAKAMKANPHPDIAVMLPTVIAEPERYFVDAQLPFGDRILHLFALLRKEDESRNSGDASLDYAFDGSLFFFEPLKIRRRNEKVQRTLLWLYGFLSRIFKSITLGTWVALVPLVVTAKLLDVI